MHYFALLQKLMHYYPALPSTHAHPVSNIVWIFQKPMSNDALVDRKMLSDYATLLHILMCVHLDRKNSPLRVDV